MSLSVKNDIASLQGALDHNTVATALKQWQALQPLPDTLDLSGVSHSNSAGVALLLEMTERHNEKTGNPLRIQNMPEQMHRVAKLGGIDKLLTTG